MPSAAAHFERDFAAQHGFAGAVAAGFGRTALRLALQAADVRGGDVLVPDFVCAQVPEAVRRASGTPVFYSVSRDLSVSPDAFRSAFTPATRAAIAVHYFGCPLPSIATMAQICRERRTPLLEDCALALGTQGAGAHGDMTVFSFTKSDWCYGGGLLAARSPELLRRARTIRDDNFCRTPALAFCYGLLRHADFAANRPARTRAAEIAGRPLEKLSGCREQSFYDAGRFDALMPAFAARRALRILETLPAATARRRAIIGQISAALGNSRHLLFRPDGDPQDSGAFLLLKCEAGQAHAWRERAAREGVTLRLCWPAYQDAEPAQAGTTLDWLAENLLVLEIHPDLKEWEVQRVACCLTSLVP